MAASETYTPALAAREHLMSGKSLTRLDALILFGLSNLPELIYELRRQKFKIEKRDVTYAAVMVRINEFAVLKPPPNLPIREIMLTDYWISK